MSKPATALRAGLARIISLTFQDAVNGHLNDAQTITREEICEVYEIARTAANAYPALVEALRDAVQAIQEPMAARKSKDGAAAAGNALLRELGEAS